SGGSGSRADRPSTARPAPVFGCPGSSQSLLPRLGGTQVAPPPLRVDPIALPQRSEPGGLYGGVPRPEANYYRPDMGPQGLLPAPLHLGDSLGCQRPACQSDVPVHGARLPPVAAGVFADRPDDRLPGPEGAVPGSAGPAPL